MIDLYRAQAEETEWLYAPEEPYAQRDGATLRLQLIFPFRRDMPADERYPVVLFVPGAAWYRQEMYNSVPQWAKLAERGAVVAAVQVRSSQEAVFPAQTEDLMDAIRHLAREAEKWHIDPHRMFLAGHSSGGHIALMTVMLHMAELAAAQEYTLRGVIAASAPTDLRLCGGKPSLDLLGLSSLEEDPERVAAASCYPYVNRTAPLPRILLIHGTQDAVVPIAHTERLHHQLVLAGKRVEFLCLSGAGHGGAWQWRNALLDRMMKFMRDG
ncbi:MAG: hypothetical protein E7327_00760 [Clostridiales bacterium]|nr:hypothetical protein [Clostridiales bacterium]